MKIEMTTNSKEPGLILTILVIMLWSGITAETEESLYTVSELVDSASISGPQPPSHFQVLNDAHWYVDTRETTLQCNNL